MRRTLSRVIDEANDSLEQMSLRSVRSGAVCAEAAACCTMLCSVGSRYL